MDNQKHIIAVNACIKSPCREKFLVLKRNSNEIAYPGKWAIPGGKLEKGERILDALKREVKEETALEIENFFNLLKDFTFVRKDGHNVVGLVFEVKALSDKVIIPEDFEEFKWVTPQEFFELDYIPGMEEEVKLAFKKF